MGPAGKPHRRLDNPARRVRRRLPRPHQALGGGLDRRPARRPRLALPGDALLGPGPAEASLSRAGGPARLGRIAGPRPLGAAAHACALAMGHRRLDGPRRAPRRRQRVRPLGRLRLRPMAPTRPSFASHAPRARCPHQPSRPRRPAARRPAPGLRRRRVGRPALRRQPHGLRGPHAVLRPHRSQSPVPRNLRPWTRVPMPLQGFLPRQRGRPPSPRGGPLRRPRDPRRLPLRHR